jgi:hypothetical protein
MNSFERSIEVVGSTVGITSGRKIEEELSYHKRLIGSQLLGIPESLFHVFGITESSKLFTEVKLRYTLI